MRILSKEEFEMYQNDFHKLIKKGELFIYPTDTIYGVGCDATNESAVKKLREIKNRNEQSFSIIAPSVKWILENCEVNEEDVDLLPGAVTIIVPLKNKNSIAKNVSNGETLGVRIPNHWIFEAVQKLGRPIITTSVNITGEAPATNTEDIPTSIKGKVSFAIDEGEKKGRPSTIIDLVSKKTIER